MRLRHAVGLAAALRVALLAWGTYQDAHSPVPYTDIDYYVFSDAAACLLDPAKPLCSPAKGPWGAPVGLGDPYARATYRYTPLVALLLVPNEWVHPAFGKVLFALADLVVGCLLYRLLVRRRKDASTTSSSYAANAVAAIWLLNPIIANISTRGSSESIVGAVVVSTLALAVQGKWDAAAVLFGLAVHVKIFPFMYGSSLIAAIVGARNAKPPTRTVIGRLLRFGAISFASFMTLNMACYLLCVLGLTLARLSRSRGTENPLASFLLSTRLSASDDRSSKRHSCITCRASTTATTFRPTSTLITSRTRPPRRPSSSLLPLPVSEAWPVTPSRPSCPSSSSRSDSGSGTAQRTFRTPG